MKNTTNFTKKHQTNRKSANMAIDQPKRHFTMQMYH